MTWADGTRGVSGTISEENSLVGTTAEDGIGFDGLRILANGNYVVLSGGWDNGAVADVGAVTWGSGLGGLVGRVSSANSLVGSTQQDNVGRYGAVLLTNGNYVLRNLNWDHGSIMNAGAVTWLDGQTPTAGEVSTLNSLVGSTSWDQVGHGGVTALTNGNYVVRSYQWDKGTVVDAGAVTWGNGSSGTVGLISSANSLVGDRWGDYVGYGYVLPLANGNYVASSPLWDNGAVTDAGAATWGNGNGGTVGSITSENSLVGTTDQDHVGNTRLIALPNGNYLVQSLSWHNGALVNAGAVTWGNGATRTAGPVTAANSLVGSRAYDRIGENGIFVLESGNFLISTVMWDDGEQQNVGALTWGSSQGGLSGPIDSTNSVLGRTTGDSVGYFGATELPNGNLLIASPGWDDGDTKNAGAVTFGNGNTGVFGAVTPLNSVVGVASHTGLEPVLVLDRVNKTVIARFLTEGGGKVRVGSWDEGFNNAPLAAKLALHRNAQRLLRPLLVANPYAESLTFLDDKTRTRRDHVKYLTLIRAIALLHQYQRPIKTVTHGDRQLEYIEVTLDDIAVANSLASEALGRSVDELPPQTRRLLTLIDEMVVTACERHGLDRADYRFSRRDIREATGWGHTQLKIHLKRLEELEYLLIHRGGRGQSFVYELLYDPPPDAGKRFLARLIDVERLRQQYDGERSGTKGDKSARGRNQVGGKSALSRIVKNAASADGSSVMAESEPPVSQTANLEQPTLATS